MLFISLALDHLVTKNTYDSITALEDTASLYSTAAGLAMIKTGKENSANSIRCTAYLSRVNATRLLLGTVRFCT